jgi:hypothetical protein
VLKRGEGERLLTIYTPGEASLSRECFTIQTVGNQSVDSRVGQVVLSQDDPQRKRTELFVLSLKEKTDGLRFILSQLGRDLVGSMVTIRRIFTLDCKRPARSNREAEHCRVAVPVLHHCRHLYKARLKLVSAA